MSTTNLYPLLAFAFVSAITPGPNNILLMSSGANHGFRKTIPHMLGVYFGFIFMIAVIGFGVADIFETYPGIQKIMQMACGTYLALLAFKIAFSTFAKEEAQIKKPMSFIEAAMFQWINPKAWTMALSAVAIYTNGNTLGVVAVILAYSLVDIPAISVWVFAGLRLKSFLEKGYRLAIFNIVLAVLLFGSLFPVLVLK
ncbi:LysE family translocator [Halobacteriovorax sp. ZH5_bin.2]|uniref:LysE family translocator n=1 Tax=unclassified Halobacteriovorax TaxID=2639665 RepID=UPI003710426E